MRTRFIRKSRDVRERVQDDTVKGDAEEIQQSFSQNSMSYEAPAVVASVCVIEPVEPSQSGSSKSHVLKNALKVPERGKKLSTNVKLWSPD